MTMVSNNKNNSNSIEFFYSNLEKMSLFGVTVFHPFHRTGRDLPQEVDLSSCQDLHKRDDGGTEGSNAGADVQDVEEQRNRRGRRLSPAPTD